MDNVPPFEINLIHSDDIEDCDHVFTYHEQVDRVQCIKCAEQFEMEKSIFSVN